MDGNENPEPDPSQEKGNKLIYFCVWGGGLGGEERDITQLPRGQNDF